MFSPSIDRYTYISRSPIESISTGYLSNGKFIENSNGGKKGDHKYYSYESSYWNNFGRIPIIRSISGTLRACLGVADVVTGIALAIIQQNSKHLHIAKTGVENIIRGTVEVAGDAIFVASFYVAFSLNNDVLAPIIFLSGLFGPTLALGAYDNAKDPKQTIIFET